VASPAGLSTAVATTIHGRQGTDHFPEIEYDKIDALRGMNISITTTAKTDDEAKSASRRLQIPVQELREPWPNSH
jgi:ribosomal protein L5